MNNNNKDILNLAKSIAEQTNLKINPNSKPLKEAVSLENVAKVSKKDFGVIGKKLGFKGFRPRNNASQPKPNTIQTNLSQATKNWETILKKRIRKTQHNWAKLLRSLKILYINHQKCFPDLFPDLTNYSFCEICKRKVVSWEVVSQSWKDLSNLPALVCLECISKSYGLIFAVPNIPNKENEV